MSDLRTVVYVSTAVREFTEPQLEALLVEVRALNRQSGVTGVLLYDGGTFMQCFEGSADAVRTTYARIRASRRHKDVIELLNQPVEARVFSDWQMGFARASRSDLLAISTSDWLRQSGRSDAMAAASPGLMLLQNFWKRAGG